MKEDRRRILYIIAAVLGLLAIQIYGVRGNERPASAKERQVSK